jgi:glycosyltransferase involved in cell wall biosynthesis
MSSPAPSSPGQSSPDTTAVVPCFNYGRYLGEAVESLLSQQPSPLVIVVDDGSTDPSTDRALKQLPSGVEVLRLPNRGVARARNAGLAAATTPYVLTLDADDRLAPGALSTLRRALEQHPDAGFAYGDQLFFGSWSGEMRFPAYDPLRLLDRHLIGPTALMRIELIRDTGGYDGAFALYEDWELWLAALEHGWQGVHVDAFTHEYRQHGDSKLAIDRRRYRAFRRQAIEKHRTLYARRRALAAGSDLGRPGRLAYRWFWGPRPVPAVIERVAVRLMLSSSSA